MVEPILATVGMRINSVEHRSVIESNHYGASPVLTFGNVCLLQTCLNVSIQWNNPANLQLNLYREKRVTTADASEGQSGGITEIHSHMLKRQMRRIKS